MARFDEVSTQPDWPALEREVLAWWDAHDSFAALARQNAGNAPWSFQDGPITANNPMGVHHAWGRTYKDVWQRYKAMQGYDQRWQNGFDCQGLWVEVNVERQLGFETKRDIEDYGIARFVRRCKERVLRMAALQTEQSIRLGMWMHWDDPDTLRRLADELDGEAPITVQTPMGEVTETAERLAARLGHAPWHGSYFTFSDRNNYMIWRFLKTCHARGWIYRGTDVMPWCARCGTGLSQHEIATEGYQEITHRSPTVRFPLVEREGALLVWTTTPWTLTANVAAAVGPALTYVRARRDDDVVYVAEAAAENVLDDGYTIEARLPGTALVGWRYEGPFDALPAATEARAAHRVIAWDEVGAEEGTGVVHIAPGCGAEDFQLGREHDLPTVAPLTEDGRYQDGFGWLTGRHAGQVADDIIADLEKRGRLFDVEPYTHRYPVCWRCGEELVFRLVDEWFIDMGQRYDKPREAVTADEKAGSLRYQMMDVVDDIRWIPSFGRERELDWLRNMDDWMISKKRYWGLALPIWRCDDCGWFDVIGGREELETRATDGLDALEGHSPHRPYIDAVTVRCEDCGATAERVPDVGNPWLDAGIVPFSTLPYDEDEEAFRRWFPADFITESFPGQFRNWFYSLLAMSTTLESEPSFKTVLGFATLYAEDGREMHKSWGNMIEFNEAAERMGADVMRWMYLAHRPEANLKFGYGPGSEVRRRFLIPLWNVYGFFTQYANLAAGWSPPDWRVEMASTADERPADDPWAALDRWIELRLAETAATVTTRMDDYDAYRATAALEALVEDLSNWYVRRSRRRFWEGESAALDTLYRVLTGLTRLLAPMIPFTTEKLYQNLVRAAHRDAPESVHHTPWPTLAAPDADDRRLLDDMALVVRLAALGRAARSSEGMKLRQPLGSAKVAVRTPDEAAAVERLSAHLADELNVKRVELVRDEGSLVSYSLRPVLPVLGPKYGPQVPAIRQALEAADAGAVAEQVARGEPIELALSDGETVTLAPDEVEVMGSAREGLATAEEEGLVVGVATELTDGLRAEGRARDLVRLIQQLRKDSGLEITDRIRLTLDLTPAMSETIAPWTDYIADETLATSLAFGPAPEGASTTEEPLDGEPVCIALERDAIGS